MKKIIKILLVILFVFLSTTTVYARAGGGSSGGSGGSSGGGSSSRGTSTHHTNSNRQSSLLERIISIGCIMLIGSAGIIIVKYRIKKAGIKTKHNFKKTSWDYKATRQRIIDSYYIIQESWQKGDMTEAKDYMDESLYENFKIKLNWLEVANKKNIMKKIKLLQAYPISLYDDKDDSKDNMWVYIKGKMIDYTINTETNEIVDGNTRNNSFVEFWQFTKNEKNNWVLTKILQENELDNIPIES